MAQYEMDVPAPNLWKLMFFDTLFELFFSVCSIHPQMGLSENTVSQNLLVLICYNFNISSYIFISFIFIHPQIPSQPPSRPAAQPCPSWARRPPAAARSTPPDPADWSSGLWWPAGWPRCCLRGRATSRVFITRWSLCMFMSHHVLKKLCNHV